MHPKITIVSPVYPYRGGIANFTEALYERLKERAEVEIVNFKRQYPSLLFPGKTQYETDTRKALSSKRIIDSLNPFTWFEAGKLIRKAAPDFLIFAYWHPFFALAYGTIASIARKNGKTKVIALCHNVLPHERSFWNKPVTKFFFKAVDSFITLSENVIPDLREVKKNPDFKVLFHPVYSDFGSPVPKDLARQKLGLPQGEKVILFFGLIRKYKGLDVLLRAAAILRKKMDFKLLVAGEFYDDKDVYEKIAGDLRLSEVVIFRDEYIPSEEVKFYFSAADIVVLPYKSATQSGIAQLAHNFHKPVIASNVGGLGEIIKNGANGYTVKPEDPQELANAILRFFENNEEEKFSANIRLELEKHSWEKFSNAFLEFLEK